MRNKLTEQHAKTVWQALEATNYNYVHAAKRLGLNRTTLRMQVKRLPFLGRREPLPLSPEDRIFWASIGDD